MQRAEFRNELASRSQTRKGTASNTRISAILPSIKRIFGLVDSNSIQRRNYIRANSPIFGLLEEVKGLMLEVLVVMACSSGVFFLHLWPSREAHIVNTLTSILSGTSSQPQVIRCLPVA